MKTVVLWWVDMWLAVLGPTTDKRINKIGDWHHPEEDE